ncbi:MAG: hypothetical protein GX974_06415, partial [Clostridiales bacterium]|nr:hypothetical protein [Clostridiales bacterium]
GNERDENYVKYLIRKICDAALLALKRMQSVNIGIGIGHEESIAFNRRFLMDDGTYRTNPGINNPSIVKPVGPIDPEVLVARVDNEDGTPIGAIVNYTCHLDVVGGDKFSADYPGELRRVLKRLYGDDFITLFFTGTCGNINHLDVTGNMKIVKDHHKKMGRILAGEVFKVMQRVEYLNNPKVLCASRHIQASIREATKEELIEARNVLNTRDKPESEILFAKDILELSRSDKRKVELEVQVIGVGDLAIVGLPGEVFVEFGLDIKRRSKFGYTAISELTNGAYGYIPVREAFEQGGYEPRLSQYTNLGPNTGYELVDSAVEILDSL